jgi:hypothetical protein
MLCIFCSKALENVRLHDPCKEVKALLDTGTLEYAIPDSLIAKVVKLRLLALKQEGIEAKNVLKAQKVFGGLD